MRACNCRWIGAAGREPLLRQDPALAGSGGDDPLAVRLDGRAGTRARAARPDVPPTKLKKVGVIGAGFMGAGIAYVSAQAGLEVVLIDRDQEAADKGKAFATS
jgi:NADPH-dependent 2,4-dienoyl-CoA reductase/sulfur reductase-like enzyme